MVLKNMNDLVRQAQVMQNKMAKLQAEMAERVVDASAGGGMVKVSVNGKNELKSGPRRQEGSAVRLPYLR